MLEFNGNNTQKKTRGKVVWKVSTIATLTGDKSENEKLTYISEVAGEGLQVPSLLKSVRERLSKIRGNVTATLILCRNVRVTCTWAILVIHTTHTSACWKWNSSTLFSKKHFPVLYVVIAPHFNFRLP